MLQFSGSSFEINIVGSFLSFLESAYSNVLNIRLLVFPENGINLSMW